MKDLNMDAYRFSISWSRILPINAKLEATVARQIQAQYQTTGKQVLQDALKSSFEISVVPAFEKSCKAMFDQVDSTFQKGMVEHSTAVQQRLESGHTLLAMTLRRAMLVDEIWHAAGDNASDIDWYAKRTVLAGIYSTTEIYMLTDTSPDFHDTWAFLDARVEDAFDLKKTIQELHQTLLGMILREGY
ncbi:uncharacterized protein [Arachis hypogaea]